jgi:hypothetical protein
MKKLITLILVLSAWNTFAQLTLVRETATQLVPFKLSNGESMLYSIEYSKNNKYSKLNLYKRDFSLYKVVTIPQVFPYDTTSFTNNYINFNQVGIMMFDDDPETSFSLSDRFFNNDDKIEFVISYRSTKYLNSVFYSKTTNILVNEDGQEIIRFNNDIGDIDIVYWDYLNITFRNEKEKPINTKIYSIPGNLPCPTSCSQKAASIAPITPPNEFKGIQVTGFPNPSSDKVTLASALPEGVAFGTLRLYTQTGEMVKEFKVSSQVDHLELPVSEYTPGTYYYELQAGGSTSGGKKMVVIH